VEASQKDPALPFTHPAFWLGTVFGVGRIPFAPGTWASLVALLIGWFVTGALGHSGIALLTLLFIPIGIWAADVCADASESSDPPAVVIDEVVALWAILAFVPREVLFYSLGFLLFRAADILKPWPIRQFERRVPGGIGIMADDWLAAAYALAGVYVVKFVIG
jgi:phosphatidylglycerophosphatase A